MKYWIYKPKFDLPFIVLPPFFITFLVLVFPKQLQILQNNYSFCTWLFLIVFIDVAHVYASLFKSYLNPEAFKKQKQTFILVPIIALLISVILYLIGDAFFWTTLAYVAVFHFIRQQYGFMKLYARKENRTNFQKIFDNVVIYTATLYPMIYWFSNKNLKFNWFFSDEFLLIKYPIVLQIAKYLYLVIILLYVLHLLYLVTTKNFNLPKHLLIVGTILSWYLSIVYYNNDLIFTLFNVVSHGIPYMALVYFTEIKTKSIKFKFIGSLKNKSSWKYYILILLVIAFLEEFVWEITHWNEHFILSENWIITDNLLWLAVPLLALPQLTHYILDGFIWKSKKA